MIPWQWRSGEAHCARPTAIKSWQMRSGDGHCQTELADEVRRRSLRSRAGRWGPARRRRRRRRRRSCAPDIKSNNPHLAGGEKNMASTWYAWFPSPTTRLERGHGALRHRDLGSSAFAKDRHIEEHNGGRTKNFSNQETWFLCCFDDLC